MKTIIRFLLLLILPVLLQAGEDSVLSFQGHLGKELLQSIQHEIDSFHSLHPKRVIILIDSQSGEFVQALDVAKALFEAKEKERFQLIVYISNYAVGPSAIFPFLADKIVASPVVSWGAITTPETAMPLNLLRSRLMGFLSPNGAHFPQMQLLLNAMIDPSIVTQNLGISNHPNETLIINQTDLSTLGIVTEFVSEETFLKANGNQTVSKQLHPLPATASSFEEDLMKHIQREGNGQNLIGRIVIDDRQNGITQATWLYVNAALAHYRETKPCFIILELNTPGGEVFAAQRISDALKELDSQYSIPIIAYVNNWAISAGAMLAYSCRYIVVAKDASMGAAEPVIMSEPGKMEEASEKINSALRTDFANRAKYFERNPFIAEAMVDKDVILVERHGQVIKLDNESNIRKGGLDPDVVISSKGKLLTMSAEQLIQYHVANKMLLPIKLEPVSLQEQEAGLWPLQKSPFSQIEALQQLAPCSVSTFMMDWQTRFLSFLSLPAVASILFLAMVIGFYIEVSTPGFGVGGVLGVTALFFIILSSFALEAIHWLEPLLFLFGVIFITMELFFFPTLGILAVLGVLFMIIGLVGMMLPGIGSIQIEGDSLNAAGEYVLSRLGWISGSFIVACILIWILSRYMVPHIKVMQKFVLTDTQMLATGEHDMRIEEPVSAPLLRIGDICIVTATLRPAGKIVYNDIEYDAISCGNYITKGVQVRVIGLEGSKIIVEEMSL